MNAKQRKQYIKLYKAKALKLADWFDKMANDETKSEILTKTDLRKMAKTLREILV